MQNLCLCHEKALEKFERRMYWANLSSTSEVHLPNATAIERDEGVIV